MLYQSIEFRPTLLVPNLLDIEWDAFEILDVPYLEILEIVIKYHQTLMGDLSWALLLNLVLVILVVTMLLMLLQVGEPFELIPHVVELSRHSLVVNPQATFDSLAPRP